MSNSVATSFVDKVGGELKLLSEELWNNPELGLEEHKAHKLLTDFLEKNGFDVERGFCGMDTAFRARFGSGPPNVCVICEYDALPEIGHACGHNLIAEAGIGAGLGVKAFLESQKDQNTSGTVTIMGTPAEETIAGKSILIERGAFKNVDIAVMAHPAPDEIAMPKCLASCDIQITFTGKAAHAAAFPWEGVNALDAAVLAYTNISALRQQMKPTWRVHGIFADGGVKPNIIPEKACLWYFVRTETMEDMKIFKEKVRCCCIGAAEATGCTYEFKEAVEALYENMQSNEVLARMYSNHLQSLGVTGVQWTGDFSGSTDMGNVSHVVPSIHPVYKITDFGNHTREFADVSNTTAAHVKTLAVAKALSLTCIDVISGGDDVLRKVKDCFK